MKNKILLHLSLLLFMGICFAQIQFARAVGGEANDDLGESIVQTSDGGYAVAGRTNCFGPGNGDFFLVKFSLLGAVEWSSVVGGTEDEWSYSVVQTTDGGYAVAGRTYSFGIGTPGYPNLFLVKFSSTGNYEWSRAVGGTSNDEGYSVVQTSDGGYAVAGWTNSFGTGSPGYPNLFLVKFSSAGVYEWSRAVGGTSSDYGSSIVQTSDSGYAVVGCTESFGAGNRDLFLLKFSTSGVIEWSRTVGGTSDDNCYSIIQTSDSGYAVAGYTESFGAGEYDLFLVRLTSTGSVTWTRSVGGTKEDYVHSIIQTTDGDFAVAGKTFSFGVGTPDSSNLFLVMFSSSGALQWSRAVGGIYTDYGNSVVQTSDNGYAVAGETYSFGAGYGDLFLVKFDSLGNSCLGDFVTPTVTIPSPTITTPSPTVTSPTPTVTIVTPTVTIVTPEDTLLCENLYVSGAKIKPQRLEISVLPNPFNSSCKITTPKDAKVEIYNEEGQKIAELKNGQNIWSPAKEVSSGTYLVKATTKDGQVATKRIVFMK